MQRNGSVDAPHLCTGTQNVPIMSATILQYSILEAVYKQTGEEALLVLLK